MINLRSKSTGHVVTVPPSQVVGLEVWEGKEDEIQDLAAAKARKEAWLPGHLRIGYIDLAGQRQTVELHFPSFTLALGTRDVIARGADIELEVL